jgi:hypothetical protein
LNRRELWLSAAAALWGVAITLSLAAFVRGPAPPGQLPSLATRINMDAHTNLRFIALLIGLPIALPLLLRPIIRRLSADDAQAWSGRTAAWSCVAAMWFVILTRAPGWVIAAPAIAWAAAFLLRRRRLDFTRDDVILIPTFATVWLALTDRFFNLDQAVLAGALIVLLLRIGVTFIRGPLPAAFAFMLAPLGLVLQTSLAGKIANAAWPSLLIALLSPFLLRPLLRDKRMALRIIALAIYPLAAFSYSEAVSLVKSERAPRVNFFEHGHGLMPASEMLRGEKPYRDVVLAHGLLEDGLFDYAAVRLGGTTVGSALGAREIVVRLGAVAVYALGAVVSGSPHVGILTYFLSAVTGVTVGLRPLPAVVALALAVTAVRRRDPRWLLASAAAVGVAFITSLDFAAYSAVALLVATVRFRRDRRCALVMAAIGAAGAAAVLALALVIAGILGDFVNGTFREVPALASLYALEIYAIPDGFEQFRYVPEIAAAYFVKSSHYYVAWLIALIFVGATLPRRRSRAVELLLVVAVFIVVAAVSYAERRHLHFQAVAGAFFVPAVFLMFRRRSPYAPAAALILTMSAGLTVHAAITAWVRNSAGPVDAEWREIANVPRARGALFHANDVASVEAVREYLETSLQPHETFFDFTNRGMFYFLFNRDCPVRQYETPYYQQVEQQLEVIRRLESNPYVRAALVPPYAEDFAIDGVRNRDRAPLVWKYIETHFRPHYVRGDVVFWRRR